MTDASPDGLAGDLQEHVYRIYANTSELDRERSRWVMNLEWLGECRKMPDVAGNPFYRPQPGIPEFLLGIPIEIRADGGAPHLER